MYSPQIFRNFPNQSSQTYIQPTYVLISLCTANWHTVLAVNSHLNMSVQFIWPSSAIQLYNLPRFLSFHQPPPCSLCNLQLLFGKGVTHLQIWLCASISSSYQQSSDSFLLIYGTKTPNHSICSFLPLEHLCFSLLSQSFIQALIHNGFQITISTV